MCSIQRSLTHSESRHIWSYSDCWEIVLSVVCVYSAFWCELLRGSLESLKTLSSASLLCRGTPSACPWNKRNMGHYSGWQLSGTFEVSIKDTDIKIFYIGKYTFLSITSVLLELDGSYIFSRYSIYLLKNAALQRLHMFANWSQFWEIIVKRISFRFAFSRKNYLFQGDVFKESQNDWGWKRCLEVIWSNFSTQAGSVAKGHVQRASEYLYGWRLYNLAWQPVPVLGHLHCTRVFPDVKREPCVFQFVHIVPASIIRHHWKEPGSTFFAPSFQVFIES